jgi:hypothetical protein
VGCGELERFKPLMGKFLERKSPWFVDGFRCEAIGSFSSIESAKRGAPRVLAEPVRRVHRE